MTDNLRIWNAVQKTNPANTKKVTQRGGFTSICAQSQIMAATAQFGPIGEGWGYDAGEPIFHDNLVFVRVTLWHGDRDNLFGPVTGGAEWKNNKGYLDSDAPKKATTDAITKLLSQLGFNADVFLGLYDDNKYVAQVTREFEAKELTGTLLASEREALTRLNEVKDNARLVTWYEDNRVIIESAEDASKAVLRASYSAKLKQYPNPPKARTNGVDPAVIQQPLN